MNNLISIIVAVITTTPLIVLLVLVYNDFQESRRFRQNLEDEQKEFHKKLLEIINKDN